VSSRDRAAQLGHRRHRGDDHVDELVVERVRVVEDLLAAAAVIAGPSLRRLAAVRLPGCSTSRTMFS
jgi:hypothetical protein